MNLSKWMMLALLALVLGCGKSETASPESAAADPVAKDEFVVETEPAGALPVGEARDSIKHDESVTLIGTIGGSTEPFVDGLAAFTIVDTKVPYCAADEGCPTPWDYCCEQDQVSENIATVKLVDGNGNPVAVDARTLIGVEELSTVVVQGKAERDDRGNLVVAATSVFVRPGTE